MSIYVQEKQCMIARVNTCVRVGKILIQSVPGKKKNTKPGIWSKLDENTF